MYNLLRHLSERNEVRQFSQSRSAAIWSPPSCDESERGSSYTETTFDHPAATLVGELAERSWVSAPVLSGAALHLVRPNALVEMLEWAEVVMVEFPWQFEFCRRRVADVPLVLATHNVEADKFRSYADYVRPRIRRPWLAAIERMEGRAVRAAELVVAVSDADRLGLIERYGVDPASVVVVRNGVDTELYRPASPEARSAARRGLGLPDRQTVVFAGSAVPPNRAGLEWVERLARAAPQFTFLVIGRVSPRRTEGNLIATGGVEDMGPWLDAADLSVCPIRHGGGTKIKLLQALAAGLPTVAFEHCVHGTDLIPGEHLLVVPPEEGLLVDALSQLAGDAGLAAAIASAGRKFVVEQHDWRRLAGDLEVALRRLPAGARSPSPAEPARRIVRTPRPGDRSEPIL
jgi:glycosyltransferase involved in cell wall biosynthesis